MNSRIVDKMIKEMVKGEKREDVREKSIYP
jgi:hypothetical protein